MRVPLVDDQYQDSTVQLASASNSDSANRLSGSSYESAASKESDGSKEERASADWVPPEEIILDHLRAHRQIGRGAFGIVYAGTYQGNPIAIKV